MSNTDQFVSFVRGIDEDFIITEEMFGLRGIKDNTVGENVFQELKIFIAKFNVL